MRLNLGCGFRRKHGFINVDSQAVCEPDQVVDLEQFPWPWGDNEVTEVYMSHVLEHLGAATETYLKIIQELYRVCAPNAKVTVIVPHPRSDAFVTDPTHVRPITILGLQMFDQDLNRQSIEQGHADTPLGIYLGVNFKLESTEMQLDEFWMRKVRAGEIGQGDLEFAIRCYDNVIDQMTIVLRAAK